jgi:hypothetical protein
MVRVCRYIRELHAPGTLAIAGTHLAHPVKADLPAIGRDIDHDRPGASRCCGDRLQGDVAGEGRVQGIEIDLLEVRLVLFDPVHIDHVVVAGLDVLKKNTADPVAGGRVRFTVRGKADRPAPGMDIELDAACSCCSSRDEREEQKEKDYLPGPVEKTHKGY